MRALFRVILRSCERPKGSAKSMHADGRCDPTIPCEVFFDLGFASPERIRYYPRR